jgi:hypothetical protein
MRLGYEVAEQRYLAWVRLATEEWVLKPLHAAWLQCSQTEVLSVGETACGVVGPTAFTYGLARSSQYGVLSVHEIGHRGVDLIGDCR